MGYGGERKRGQIWMGVCALGILCFLFGIGEIQAMAGGLGEPFQEVEVSLALYESREDVEPPEDVYVDSQGVEYELKTWYTEEVLLPQEHYQVEKEVWYEQVEDVSRLNQSVGIEFIHEGSGYQTVGDYPVVKIEAEEEYWIGNFEFEVTFHTYGASSYWLGDDQIPYREDTPGLIEYESLLLKMAGLSDTDYEVEQIVWSGDAYMDADGIPCRRALATGKKRVRDYRVTYGGVVQVPARTAYQTQAVYGLPEKVPAASFETEVEMDTVVVGGKEDGTGNQGQIWRMIRRTLMITIGLSTLVLILVSVFLLIQRRKARKKKVSKDVFDY